MLSSMIDEVKRAESEAETMIDAARAEALKVKAQAEEKAAEMILDARERAKKKTSAALAEQMKLEESADNAAAAETEKKAGQHRNRAAKYSNALGEKLREIMFA